MTEKEPAENPILRANIFSRLSFWWLNSLFGLGFKRDLTPSDIYKVLPNDCSKHLGEQLKVLWDEEVEKCKARNKKYPDRKIPFRPSLRRALFRQFGAEYMCAGVVGFVEECVLRLLQPLLLGLLIRYFSGSGEFTELEGNLFAGGVVLSAILLIYVHHSYFFGVTVVGMRLRIACCSLVFRKALRLSQASLGDTPVGQFINLLSNDVNRFEMSTVFCHFFWIGPIQTILVTVFLWHYFGPSCLVGLFILIIFIPFQGYMGKCFSKLRSRTAIKTDIRIRIMNEIVNGMRVIKLYTWEMPFSALVAESRRDEIKVIRKTSVLHAINMSIFFSCSKIITFATLLTYVLVGNALTAEKVFVSLALYNNIRLNMTLFFPNAISSLAEALVSIHRIEDILLMDEKETPAISDQNYNDDFNSTPAESKYNVTMDNFTGKWKSTYENTLTDISFTVGAGELMAIIGHVGAGKGSILQAILKELPATTGSLHANGRIAYASQEPWVFAGSVRDNILFGKEFASDWYNQVVKACALAKDFQLLPYGDRTLVGDRGNSLSGGQRARINLARAVYADADIYLLDDPLSAVDAEVGRHLFDKCVNGILQNKIRILVTHQLQFLKTVNHIVLMENGKVQKEGTYDELIASGIDFAQLMASNTERKGSLQPLSSTSIGYAGRRRIRTTSDTSVNSEGLIIARQETGIIAESSIVGNIYSHEEVTIDIGEMEHDSNKAIVSLSKTQDNGKGDEENLEFLPVAEEESKSSGNVKWSLYFRYFAAGSNCFTLFMLVFSNIIAQAFYTGSDYWLNIWSKAEERRSKGIPSGSTEYVVHEMETDRDFQVAFYSAIVAAVFITSMWRTVLFFRVSLNSSIKLHNSMFDGVIRAPMRFFEVNPAGRLLNRFSRDIGNVDDLLPRSFFDAIEIMLNVIAIVILIGVVNPILLGAAVLLLIMLYFLRSFYLRTARSIKRLEAVARSPVFSHLSTALFGLPTIRAFKAETQFIKEFDAYLDLHSGSWHAFLASTRWFGHWLDWISTFFIAAVTFSFIIGSGDGPTVGLVISQVIQLSGMFQWGIRQSAEVENQMISVERVIEYTKIKPEAAFESEPGKKPPADWPTKGDIKMYHVQLCYGEEPPTLQDITCEFRPSEKVGIVGRTGAGKSSLISALFRIAEPTGEILIDGINILKIGLHDLRAKIAIIPQDPVLYMGSLRKNLDPFNNFKDNEIWKVLEQVQLAYDIKASNSGLDLEVTENGSNFSVGQRQLLCLARAILKQCKILVLDEATANVDPETDALIQKTIRTIFLNCTVLTVAHRLNTVMDSDRILVLDAGHIREFDEPYTLLQDKDSELYHLVQETGKDSAQNLYQIAKEAMDKRHPIPPKQASTHSKED